MTRFRSLGPEILPFAVLLLLGLAHTAFWRRAEFPYWDGAYYSGIAEAILHTHDYLFNGLRHTPYPPGMPLLLAGIMAVFGESYAVQIIAIGVFGALGLAVAFLVLRSMGGWRLAFLLCLVLGSSATFFSLNTFSIVSDTAYFFTSMLCLLLAGRLEAVGESASGRALVAALAVLVSLSVLIRPIGMALVAGLALWLAASRWFEQERFRLRWRRFGPALLAGAAAQAWWTWYSRVHEVLEWPGQYLHSHWKQLLLRDYFRPELGTVRAADLAARVAENLAAQAAAVTTFATNQWVNAVFPSPAVVLPVVLVTAGLLSSVWRQAGSWAAWYAGSYLGILLLWPYPLGMDRFLVPVMPLVLLYLWRGGGGLLRLLEAGRQQVWMTSAAVTLVLVAWSAGRWFLVPEGRSGQSLAALAFWTVLMALSLAAWRWRWTGPGERWKAVQPWLAGGALLVVLALGVRAQARIAAGNLNPPPAPRAAEVQAARWMQANTPPETVVMAEQVSIVHRVSRRRTIHFPITSNAEVVTAALLRHRVRFLVVNDAPQDFRYYPAQQERVERIQRAYPGLLRLCAQAAGYRIFEVAAP